MMYQNQEDAMIYKNEDKADGQVTGAAAQVPPPQFPLRLHDMLDQAEQEGYQHIVSWLPEGNGFQIHDPEAMLPILQKCGFNQSKYKSFLRQLQNYGFRREIRGPHKGKCTHELFALGRRELCQNMRRIRKSGSEDSFNLKPTKRSTGSIASQAIALSEGQGYARAALSAPSMTGNASFSSTGMSMNFARMGLMNSNNNSSYNNGNSMRNANFDFVPRAPMTMGSRLTSDKSRHHKSLLMNGADQLIWDIQKELSKVSNQKSSAQQEDLEPLSFRGPRSALPLLIDGMNELEVTETMCSIFLEEPSLEDTYA